MDLDGSFVSWVQELVELEAFEASERTYKLDLSEEFQRSLRDGLDTAKVLSWLKDNNVVRWQTTSSLEKCDDSEALAVQVLRLVGDGNRDQRITSFAEWTRQSIGVAAGEQTTLTSAMLMGKDPVAYPPYKTQAVSTAMRLGGRKASTGPPAERYEQFLQFCDDVVTKLGETSVPIDRLDVQGACWVIGGSPLSEVEALLGSRAREFEQWRVPSNATTERRPLENTASGALKWWVNQGATYRQERDGSYIWAPQVTRSGRPVAHHTAVASVRKDDQFVHYSEGHIRAVGIALSDGYESDRPDELPDGTWETAGYRADVDYSVLSEPVPLASVDADLRAGAGGPFTVSGSINQGYLYEIPERVKSHLADVLAGDESETPEPPTRGPRPTPSPFDEVVGAFARATRDAGLDYGARHDPLVRSFVTALATKPFVILTGLSGSGKTRLAQAFGDWLGESKVVAVRPDWTSPDALLGFENALSKTVDGRHAWDVPATLQFMLSARDNPSQPHLLLLDEMNLAHVERYFADVLSGMESAEKILPDLTMGADGHYRLAEGAGGLIRLPENLFVVGTVNIDETTYMFSPKVLDRANTFEFRVETDDLITTAAPERVEQASMDLVAGFQAANQLTATASGPAFADWLRDVHRLLSEHDREFGHRTFQEALRFAGLLELAGETDPLVALDLQIAQKVLPRLNGSRRELTSLLNSLAGYCFVGPSQDRPTDFDAAEPQEESALLPVSFNKLHRMAKRLRDNHFVSFAE